MQTVRIAIVGGGLGLGGATTFSMFLARGLMELNVPVKVFSFSTQHPLEEDFRTLGIAVHREDEKRLIFEDRLVHLYSALKEFRPTAAFAIVGNEPLELFRYLPKAVFRVAMIHEQWMTLYKALPMYRPYYDHVVAVSASLKTLVEELNPGIACSYLRHGVFLNPPGEVRTPNLDRPLALTYFGKLDDSAKGVFIFPEIWRRLKQAHVPFRWTIIGSGSDENVLRERMTEAVHEGDVTFHPHVPHRELGAWIRRHDVYLLTSKREAGPLTLLEAMGYGLVPICADIPCLVQELITSKNGFRVKPTDPDAYVSALAKLHRNRELLEEMSKAARHTVETGFSEVEMARHYAAFVQKYAPSESAAEWPTRIRVKQIIRPSPLWVHHFVPRLLRRLIKRLRSHALKD